MIPILVDTNVIVDVLAEREGFYDAARKLLAFSEFGDYGLWMSSSQLTDLHYILSNGGRRSEQAAARAAVLGVRHFVRVCAPGEREVDLALASAWDDFDAALVYQAAMSIGARAIVTRNAGDYAASSIPVLSPTEFFSWLERLHNVYYEEIDF